MKGGAKFIEQEGQYNEVALMHTQPAKQTKI